MRLVRPLLIALIFGTIAVAVSAAASPYYGRPSLEVDTGLFYDDLAPYGDWVETADYGWGWMPRAPSGWRPYSAGHWVWTDEFGLLWVSSEPYGWAVYHYGRWYFDPAYGWIWIPGYEWGPSWVSFRTGGGYIGWAPLPPRIGWQRGIGFRAGPLTFDTWIAPSHYCFVPERSFLDYSIPRYLAPVSRNTTIINITQNITNYTVVQDHAVNRSLRVDQIERAVRRAVPRVRTVDLTSVQSVRQASVRGDEVPVFRPKVREVQAVAPPRGRALPRRETGSQPADLRERVDREAASELEQRRGAEQRELNTRRELEKRREETARREALAGREQEQRREQERRMAQLRSETEARRDAEARRELGKHREEAVRREADAKRQLDKQRDETARREAEARRQLDRQREETGRRETEARRQVEQRRAADQQAQATRLPRERQESASLREQIERRQVTPREPQQVAAQRSVVRHQQQQEQQQQQRTPEAKRGGTARKEKERDKPRN